MVVKIKQRNPQPKKQVTEIPAPVSSVVMEPSEEYMLQVEKAFIAAFTPNIPDPLQDVAFAKENGTYKHTWTLVCFNMFKEQYMKNQVLLNQSQTVCKELNFQIAFCSSVADKAKLVQDEQTQRKAEERASALTLVASDLKRCIETFKI